MQCFARQRIRDHCAGSAWPDFLGRVTLGESFDIETERFNDANGPIFVEGTGAGDDIAVHIESIEMVGPFHANNGGPFIDGAAVGELRYEDGWFIWPNHFRLRARPSIGNIAVLPAPTNQIMEMAHEYILADGRRISHKRGWRRIVNDPRGKHCHQDCPLLNAGSIIHLKAQVEGAGLCAADVHGYIGQGEMGFAAIEVAASLCLRVERSTTWLIDWPIIETPDEIMVCCSYTDSNGYSPPRQYVDVVREAYRAMTQVVAARIGGTIDQANTIVATAVDIRNCVLYGLQGFISLEKSPRNTEIAVVAALPKNVFRD